MIDSLARSFSECVEHFYENIERDDYALRRVIEDLTGVTNNTVSRWMRGVLRPSGINRRAMYFILETIGFQVAGFSDVVSDSVRKYGLLLVFEMKTVEQAVVELNGIETRRSVFDLILARQKPSESLREAMAREVDDHQPNLGILTRKYQRKISSISYPEFENGISGSEAGVARTAEELMDQSSLSDQDASSSGFSEDHKEALLAMFRSQAKSLKRIAEIILSDKFSSADRQQLRERFEEGEGVYELSNLLNALCSETARDRL